MDDEPLEVVHLHFLASFESLHVSYIFAHIISSSLLSSSVQSYHPYSVVHIGLMCT
jgi:hypothetical protein